MAVTGDVTIKLYRAVIGGVPFEKAGVEKTAENRRAYNELERETREWPEDGIMDIPFDMPDTLLDLDPPEGLI